MTSTELDTLMTMQPPQIAEHMLRTMCQDHPPTNRIFMQSDCRECLTELIAALMARGERK